MRDGGRRGPPLAPSSRRPPAPPSALPSLRRPAAPTALLELERFDRLPMTVSLGTQGQRARIGHGYACGAARAGGIALKSSSRARDGSPVMMGGWRGGASGSPAGGASKTAAGAVGRSSAQPEQGARTRRRAASGLTLRQESFEPSQYSLGLRYHHSRIQTSINTYTVLIPYSIIRV